VLASSGSDKPNKLMVTHLFPAPPLKSWDIYRVRLRSGEGNLDPPAWARDWSTRNDQLTAQDNRTLHLEMLLEAMVRAVTENVILLDHFIAVEGN
jgi:hypothetical protein